MPEKWVGFVSAIARRRPGKLLLTCRCSAGGVASVSAAGGRNDPLVATPRTIMTAMRAHVACTVGPWFRVSSTTHL